MSWKLANAHNLNKESPYTFYIPSKAVIGMLEIGDIVKLCFEVEREEDGFGGERMWVEITEINGNDFIGNLINKPSRIQNLSVGDMIHFRTEHIYDTELSDPEASKWDYYFDTKVTVTSDVLERKKINFLIKEEPHGEGDSGWVVFSGYEDVESQIDPNSYHIISIGVILNMDDSILSFINEPPLCAYERDKNGLFYKIEDYDWDAYLNEGH